jgi:hypothetical protein
VTKTTRGLCRGSSEPPVSCRKWSGRGERIRTFDLLVPNTPEEESHPRPGTGLVSAAEFRPHERPVVRRSPNGHRTPNSEVEGKLRLLRDCAEHFDPSPSPVRATLRDEASAPLALPLRPPPGQLRRPDAPRVLERSAPTPRHDLQTGRRLPALAPHPRRTLDPRHHLLARPLIVPRSR